MSFILQKLSIGLKFRGFQSQNFAEVNFAVGQKILEIRGMKFCDLARKLLNREIFFPLKFLTIKKLILTEKFFISSELLEELQ